MLEALLAARRRGVLDIGSGPGLLACEMAAVVGPRARARGRSQREHAGAGARTGRLAAGAAPVRSAPATRRAAVRRRAASTPRPHAGLRVRRGHAGRAGRGPPGAAPGRAAAGARHRLGLDRLALAATRTRMRRVLAAWDEHLADPHLPAPADRAAADAGFTVHAAHGDADAQRRLRHGHIQRRPDRLHQRLRARPQRHDRGRGAAPGRRTSSSSAATTSSASTATCSSRSAEVARILFVAPRPSSFIVLDRALLAERHEVVDLYGNRPQRNPRALGRAVRRADVVFGWWAHLHTLEPFTLARRPGHADRAHRRRLRRGQPARDRLRQPARRLAHDA